MIETKRKVPKKSENVKNRIHDYIKFLVIQKSTNLIDYTEL